MYYMVDRGWEPFRNAKLRELLQEDCHVWPRFRQVRDRLDFESRERIVTPEEVEHNDLLLYHETVVHQFATQAELIRSTEPDLLKTLPFEDKLTSVIGGRVFGFDQDSLEPEDQPRLAAEYDRKAADAQRVLNELRERGFRAKPFNPEDALTALRSEPQTLSTEAKSLLAEHLLQQLRQHPWSLRNHWNLFALKRLDGLTVLLPSGHQLRGYAALFTILCIFPLLIVFRRRRANRFVTESRRLADEARQISRLILFPPSRQRPNR
ncbi:MAG: hypothetical protein R3B91_09110 [Planctomycetaceae bacterium]